MKEIKVPYIDIAIRRIAKKLGITEAMAGIDTHKNGGHTTDVICKYIEDLQKKVRRLNDEQRTKKTTQNRIRKRKQQRN